MDWSTVSDSPSSQFLSQDQLIAHWVMQREPSCLCEMDRKIVLADEWGSSWLSNSSALDCYSVQDVVNANRAGPGETELTLDQIWQVYGLGIPLVEYGDWIPFDVGDGPSVEVTLLELRNVLHHIGQGESGRRGAQIVIKRWIDDVKDG